jgi:hypothetical protein
MIEHISHYYIEKTLSEINRVLKPGGVLRLMTPDLEVLCNAYINKDTAKFKRYISEDDDDTGNGIRMELGHAQALLGFIVSPGFDNYLIDSSRGKILGGYAHTFCYDYELLSNLLSLYGFKDIERKSIEDSDISDHKDLRKNYDRDKEHSLIIECKKNIYIPFVKEQSHLLNGPYKYDHVVECRAHILTKIALKISSFIENFYRWSRQVAKRIIYNK